MPREANALDQPRGLACARRQKFQLRQVSSDNALHTEVEMTCLFRHNDVVLKKIVVDGSEDLHGEAMARAELGRAVKRVVHNGNGID